MEENQIFGTLFKTIELKDESHLDALLTSIDVDKSYAQYVLIQAVRKAYDMGIYTLGESEVLSKSIRVLSKEN